MQYSADLCARIGAETGQDVGWKNVGSLRLAASDARWEELKRAATAAKSYGFDMELVGPDEVRRLYPLADVKDLRGATWIASDGHVDPYSLTQAYARGARTGGVRIVEGVAVTGFTIEGRRIVGVRTVEGEIGARSWSTPPACGRASAERWLGTIGPGHRCRTPVFRYRKVAAGGGQPADTARPGCQFLRQAGAGRAGHRRLGEGNACRQRLRQAADGLRPGTVPRRSRSHFPK
jgi:glycine/D-amino acid oxidase-like deaminating enzyme